MSEQAQKKSKTSDESDNVGPLTAEHTLLDALVGELTAVSTFRGMGPEPITQDATSTGKKVHGGRFVEVDYRTNFGGMAFEGTLTIGFDDVSKNMQHVWRDNMSNRFVL
eukprot:TRINITY_DN82_c0_g1_i1.p1 TRINITY_DN82_c0_g1~~TRINITY_DN82_c0_g1_i1.p1  ORF type:complete len:109 (+),score=18.61 TRINITY_DN82_c0_g1_i1:140-466(+)